jgi:hypothetical protein
MPAAQQRTRGLRKARQLYLYSTEERIINTAQKITGCALPLLQDIFSSRCLTRSANILEDPSHPSHHMFALLPSGKRFLSIKSRRNQIQNMQIAQSSLYALYALFFFNATSLSL